MTEGKLEQCAWPIEVQISRHLQRNYFVLVLVVSICKSQQKYVGDEETSKDGLLLYLANLPSANSEKKNPEEPCC